MCVFLRLVIEPKEKTYSYWNITAVVTTANGHHTNTRSDIKQRSQHHNRPDQTALMRFSEVTYHTVCVFVGFSLLSPCPMRIRVIYLFPYYRRWRDVPAVLYLLCPPWPPRVLIASSRESFFASSNTNSRWPTHNSFTKKTKKNI